MSFDWKKTLGTVAPALATALGSPLAGLATKAIVEALGLTDGSEESLETALKNATPDQLLALKTANNAFLLEMRKLDVDLERIAASDRDSARKREAATQDHTPKILAYVIIGVWGVIQYHVFTHSIAPDMRELVIRVLGTLDGALMLVLAYYYGANSQPSQVVDRRK